ncbi:hypothetical protein R1sor_020964 [Riccia sorocarpa]|uniref:Protein FATTY ACID EXPORT 4, chloroplastic n=1 Tax=Riccia sorocarpa TaxID=122646 RepID=A0ABD3GGE9_9MARC
MEAVARSTSISACRQSTLLGVSALSSSPTNCSQVRSVALFGRKNEGLRSFCGGGISVSRLRGGRRVHLVVEERSRRSGLECRADLTDLAELAPVTAAVYGASLLGGGLFAFTRTGSKGSLGGGVVGGVALGVAFFLMQTPGTKDLGQAIGFGSSVLFAAIFGIRLAATKKVVPAGALLVVSTIATIIFANAYFAARLPGPPV